MKRDKLLFISSIMFAFAAYPAVIIYNDSAIIVLLGMFAIFVAIFIWNYFFAYLMICVLISLCYDLFGFVSVMEKLRLSWAFGATPPDILLIMMFFAVLIKMLQVRFNEIAVHENKKLIMLNGAIVLYIVFLILYSSFLTGRSSLDYAMRIGGGHFLYYSIFIIAMYQINKQSHIITLIQFIRIGALITALIAIVSNVVGYPVITILHSYYYKILRVNLPGYAFCLFIIIFGYIGHVLKQKEVRISVLEIAVNLIGFLLFLGRTWTLSLLLMFITSIYFLRKISLIKTILMLLLLLTIHQISFYFLGDINEVYVQRLESGYQETTVGKGSLVGRLDQIAAGYKVFKETPVFGTGFIREGSPFYEEKIARYGFAATYSADFGLASILYTTGIIGFVLITGFVTYSLKKMLNIFSKTKNILVKNLALAGSLVVGFDYFLTQWAGNFFGTKWVVFYLVLIGIVLKSEFLFKQETQ